MPGTTSLGIRYPLQSEIVDATSWQDMADDIDALMTSLDALRDTAVTRPTARITGGSTSVAVNTNVVLSGFNNVSWDNAGYANLGVDDDLLTVSSGIYWAYTKANMSGTTTFTMARISILVSGSVWAMQQQDDYSSTFASDIRSSGLFLVTAASATLQARARWAGTGGPATFSSQELAVYKVRDLADV